MKVSIAILIVPALLVAQSTVKEARKAFENAARDAKARRMEQARQGYERAVALDPRYAEAWSALGRLQAQQQQYDAARKSFETAIRVDPNLPDPYTPLAIILQSAHEWDALVQTTDRLLQIDAYRYPVAWLLNATGHYNLHNLTAAEKSAREAERLDTKRQQPRVFYLLAEILVARGHYPAAAAQLHEYLKFADSAEAAKTRERIAQLEQSASKATPEPTNATFRVQTDLTLVRFQVTPTRGQFLTDLRPDEFEILEDGVSRKIALFEGGRFYPRKVPLEISLLFDCSGSMEAADILNTRVFEKNLLEEYENVSVAIYGFSEELVRLTQPTRDGRLLVKAMTAALGVRRGSTPLFGSIAETVRQAVATKGNATRMLVVFSDGLSSSPGDEQRYLEASRAAQQLGVAIYPVLITAAIPSRPVAPAPTRNRMPTASPATSVTDSLQRYSSLASLTGGHAFHEVATQDILPRILSTIAKEIRYDYFAGYYSSSSDSEKSHKVEVKWRSKSRGQIIGGSRVTTPN